MGSWQKGLIPFINETLDVEMQLPDEVVCAFYPNNAECLKQRCPFFPSADEDVKAAFQPGAGA